MHRFFAPSDAISGNKIKLTGSDVNHIRNVLRLREGDEILICDGKGWEYTCAIFSIEAGFVEARIEEETPSLSELPSRITLYQGLPKSDKMDLIVQKAVELGVYRIVPVDTARTVVRLDDKKEASRLRRWNSISESAAKQSGRAFIPEVTGVMDFKRAVEEASASDVVLIPYELAEGMEDTKAVIKGIRPGESVAVFIGPEGGFERTEVSSAVEKGAVVLTLGRRTLRTETAGMFVLSILGFHLEGQ